MLCTSKGVWSVVNNIRGKNETNFVNIYQSLFSDAQSAAEYANELFASFFHDNNSFIASQTPTCNNVNICDHFVVYDYLCKLRTDKAIGSDHIPAILLKVAANHICKPLAFVFNLSYNTACVPRTTK